MTARERLTDLGDRLVRPLAAPLDKAAQAFLSGPGLRAVDFSAPKGEPALAAPDSVSWRVFKNPVTLFIGGVAAVILEFAEPRVRTGVWDHSTFRTDPLGRLRRTGLAAMVTVYGPRSLAQTMIAGVRRMHERVVGVTPSGAPYAANDPDLLHWVQATAAFSFLEAYARYAAPIAQPDRDRYFAEGAPAAALYGAERAPRSESDWRALLVATAPRFESSPIVFDFLDIMRNVKALPTPANLAQGLLVRAAVEITPLQARAALGLDAGYALRPFESALVRRIARRADRLILPSSPAAQACTRLGLPADFLYRAPRTDRLDARRAALEG